VNMSTQETATEERLRLSAADIVALASMTRAELVEELKARSVAVTIIDHPIRGRIAIAPEHGPNDRMLTRRSQTSFRLNAWQEFCKRGYYEGHRLAMILDL